MDKTEELAEIVIAAVQLLIEKKLAPILASIDTIKREVGGMMSKDQAAAMFVAAEGLALQVGPLATKAAAEIFGTLRVPADGKSVTLEDVRPLLAEMVAALPEPEPGKSVTLEDVRPLVDAAVSALPKPENGKDADPLLVREAVAAEVARQVAALPRPEDGKTGASVTIDDVRPVVALAVEAEVAKAVARIPVPQDGKSVTLDDIRPLIADAVAAIPVPQDGKSVEPAAVEAMVDAKVARAVAALPTPKDGTNGKDADLGVLRELVDISVRAAMASVPAPKDGEPGKDAEPIDMHDVERMIRRSIEDELGKWPKPENGQDGLGLDDLEVGLKEDGRTIVLTYSNGERKKTFEIECPWQIYRGVFTTGKVYQKGDVVSYGGSMFVAQRETSETPGDRNNGGGWVLAVKRGKDA